MLATWRRAMAAVIVPPMAYQPFDLSGKVALITGGNRGIGFGLAQALAQAGADLVIWGTNAAQSRDAADTLKALGRRVVTREVNVASEEAVTDGIRAAVDEMGRLDAVFANAGIGGSMQPFVDLTYAQYRSVMSVNLDGAFFTLREAARHMVERAKHGDPGGSLVAIASTAAIEGAPRNQDYAATKGALVSMIKGCAVELARYGIRANALLPGWIATDLTKPAQDSPLFAEKILPRIPARRWGKPEDIGGIAVYLASDASAYHSGDTLVIDGGYSIF